MRSNRKTFLRKLILVCVIGFVVAVLSMFISLDYLVNRSGIELDFVNPEAYKDYQG